MPTPRGEPDGPTGAVETVISNFRAADRAEAGRTASRDPSLAPMSRCRRWLIRRRGTLLQMLGRIDRPDRSSSTAPVATSARRDDRLMRAALRQGFDAEAAGLNRRTARSDELFGEQTADLLLAGADQPHLPDEVFGKLRWGGLFVHVGAHEATVRRLAEQFGPGTGFYLERPVEPLRASRLGLCVPGLSSRGWFFAARKTHLILQGEFTHRFTYDVHLRRAPEAPGGYVVEKRVPAEADLIQRLRKKNPEAEEKDILDRAHKLADHVFPTFLTREAAMLQILQRELPLEYRGRVPTALKVEQDERGFVRTLWMNWLRVGGPVLSQLAFARQAAELLAALHDHARVVHLDLRLDNLVITEQGVGFVDFGSAVRVGEQIEQSPMLTALFQTMMRTSQIQRLLGRMIDDGRVTNEAIAAAHQKVDKTLDAFYLAVLINRPHGNPMLNHLIRVDEQSDAARSLSALTAAILRPRNPAHALFKTAADILRGIRRIEAHQEPAAA